MAIDDKLEKVLDKLAEVSTVNAELELLEAAIASIPIAGGSISSLMSGQAKRRIVRRTIEMFTAMREVIERIDEKKVNREFFESDEFQTLLALAMEQLQTSHDAEKIKLLAAALANSGLEAFANESRKELFVRILRELSISHIRVLKSLLPTMTPPEGLPLNLKKHLGSKRRHARGEELAILEKLVSNGIVEESFEYDRNMSLPSTFTGRENPSRIMGQLKKYVDEPPSRVFQISEIGLAFVSFIGVDPAPTDERDK